MTFKEENLTLKKHIEYLSTPIIGSLFLENKYQHNNG